MRKNILLLFFVLLIGCGYKPIFLTSNANFTINKFEYERNKLNKVIYNNLSSYQNKENKKFIYNIKINSNEKKVTTLKNSKGDPSNFRISILVNVEVYEKQKLRMKKDYEETFDYENTSKKFELKQYEDQIKNSMLKKISEKIITDLYTVK
jgi:hypothetical protein